MKFTERMQAAINEQIALEMWSANIYLSMSAHFASLGLDGFAHWYRQQYKEELDHAEDMIQYVIRRGGQVKIQAIPAVDTEFDSALQMNAMCRRRSRSSSASLPKRRICLHRTSSGSISVSRSRRKLLLPLS